MTRVAPWMAALLLVGCAPMAAPAPRPPVAAVSSYDVLVRGGTIYDGRGGAPFSGDLAIVGDRITAVAAGAGSVRGRDEIDARGSAHCATV